MFSQTVDQTSVEPHCVIIETPRMSDPVQLTDVDVLARLKGPVLLVYGDRDAQFPPAKVSPNRLTLIRPQRDIFICKPHE